MATTRKALGRRWGITALGAMAAFACSAGLAWALPPFTTAPKASPPGAGGQAELHSLAVGCHATFDRLVLRFRLATPGYRVRLVNQVMEDPSGRPVTLLGSARLLVVVRDARAHTADGTTTLIPRVVTPLCPNIRQVKRAGDFEGIVSLGVGLRHSAGFRVFRLTNPTRIVVDVAH